MEQFDILDKSGNLTGKTAYKGVELQSGQYYLGVHAYIHNSENSFLLQQRAYDKSFRPGCWDIHMGHVMTGENSKDAIIREITEEIGLAFDQRQIRFIGRVYWEIYHHIIDIYFLKLDFDINNLALQESEVIAAKSVSKEDMLNLQQLNKLTRVASAVKPTHDVANRNRVKGIGDSRKQGFNRSSLDSSQI